MLAFEKFLGAGIPCRHAGFLYVSNLSADFAIQRSKALSVLLRNPGEGGCDLRFGQTSPAHKEHEAEHLTMKWCRDTEALVGGEGRVITWNMGEQSGPDRCSEVQ